MPAVESYASAVEILVHLNRLQLERLEARSMGLGDRQTSMTALDEEIAHYRAAFVGAAVTETAVLRGELCGRQMG
jgi:hypothetical protein